MPLSVFVPEQLLLPGRNAQLLSCCSFDVCNGLVVPDPADKAVAVRYPIPNSPKRVHCVSAADSDYSDYS